MRRGRLVPLHLVTIAVAGCAPMITHGPHVDEGNSFGAIAGWRTRLCDTLCTAGLVPPIGLYATHGERTKSGAAYSITATVPIGILVPATHVDVYFQVPSRLPTAHGAGLSLSISHVMPYVQFGRVDETGDGWYTTQGFVRAAYFPEPEVLLNGGRGSVFDNAPNTYWSSNVTYQYRGFAFWLSGAIGTERTQEYDSETDGYVNVGSRPIRSLMFGVRGIVDSFTLPGIPRR